MVTHSAYRTFAEFYPHYLAEHSNRTSRRLHFIGTTLVPVLLLAAAWTGNGWLAVFAPIQAYGLAWTGHFVFEHNRPATFRHPWWSLRGDWRMWREMLSGKIPF